MMEIISAGEFKAKCLKLMDIVEANHEEFVITKHGVPVAKMIPVKKDQKPFGVFKNKISFSCDLSMESNLGNWEVDNE